LASQWLPPLNSSLSGKKPPTLRVMREEEWSKSEAQRQAGDEPPRLKGFRLR